jgi:hypothetical protein
MFKMGDTFYDKLKIIAQIWLPATGTLYLALAQIWGLPFSEQVVGTIMAVDTFLGAILGISSKQYKKNLDIAKTNTEKTNPAETNTAKTNTAETNPAETNPVKTNPADAI